MDVEISAADTAGLDLDQDIVVPDLDMGVSRGSFVECSKLSRSCIPWAEEQ